MGISSGVQFVAELDLWYKFPLFWVVLITATSLFFVVRGMWREHKSRCLLIDLKMQPWTIRRRPNG